MVHTDGILILRPAARAEWRNWLEENGPAGKSVWVVIANKQSKVPGINYSEAVEEALCFGWIDSKANKLDADGYILQFTHRNPKSRWSALNRERIERLTADGQMMPAGQALIDMAKNTGKWEPEEEK
jgi:uncharacterized protein YdeI (YjbR/CyaY-like superfamily)